MKRKHFSLMEVMIAITILGILATIGVVFYERTVQNARTRACGVNAATIMGALEVFVQEFDMLPANLSELKPEHLNKAYAKIMKKPGAWRIKVERLLIALDNQGLAYATIPTWGTDTVRGRNYINPDFFTCPKATGPVSYGYNSALLAHGNDITNHAQFDRYLTNNPTTPIIGDSDAAHFAGWPVMTRHKFNGHNVGVYSSATTTCYHGTASEYCEPR